ncbi:hypothetical protein GCM10009777_16200 [Microbacterium pumilum]|uniref:Uncharacterized protein n=1 Tax=Microbacterium pumilum TaxID=344165 RepID=A0ABN2SA29_9MICO
MLRRHFDRTPGLGQGGPHHDGRSARRRGAGGACRTAERGGDRGRRQKNGRDGKQAVTGQPDVAPAGTPPCPASGIPERIPQRIAWPGHSVTLVSIPSRGQEDEACGADPPTAAPP